MIVVEKNLNDLKKYSLEEVTENVQYVCLDDQGYLGQGMDSLMMLVGDINRNRVDSPIYYNRLPLPDYWEVYLEEKQLGKIQFWGDKKAQIHFSEPVSKRYVARIDWLSPIGDITYTDVYSQYGKRYCRIFYENGQELTKSYYDESELVFAQTVPFSESLLISNRGKLNGYYPNRLELLKKYCQLNGISGRFVTSDKSLVNLSSYMMNYFNFTEESNLENITNSQGKQVDVYDFTYSSIGSGQHYHKIVTKNNKEDNAILILTASDQIAGIESLIPELKDFHFYLAARTDVSDYFRSLGKWENVTICPSQSHKDVQSLLEKCSYYLDINHLFEVDHIIERAVLQDLLLLTFEDYAHNISYCHPNTIFDSKLPIKLADALKNIYADQDVHKEILDYQKEKIPYDFIVLDESLESIGN